MKAAVTKWRRGVERIEEMVRDIAPDEVFRLTYEDMCRDPAGTVRRVWEFLDLSDFTIPLTRTIKGMHHISGSPSKFDPNRQEIRHDDSFVDAFDAAQLRYLKAMAQPYALKWGYR
jgi:hypothetical protein